MPMPMPPTPGAAPMSAGPDIQPEDLAGPAPEKQANLLKGTSTSVINENIRALKNQGFSEVQAIAMAYAAAGVDAVTEKASAGAGSANEEGGESDAGAQPDEAASEEVDGNK